MAKKRKKPARPQRFGVKEEDVQIVLPPKRRRPLPWRRMKRD